MSRFKLRLRNSCRLLVLLPFVMAVAALFWGGIGVTIAGANQGANHKNKDAKNSHEYHAIRDSKVDPNLSPKARARVQRDAAAKNRADARMYIQSIIEGKQPASSQGGGAQ